MSKKDEADKILRLLPLDPHYCLERARQRLEEQSEDELRKMRLALESCIPAEGQQDPRWEAAVRAASDLSGLVPFLPEW